MNTLTTGENIQFFELYKTFVKNKQNHEKLKKMIINNYDKKNL